MVMAYTQYRKQTYRKTVGTVRHYESVSTLIIWNCRNCEIFHIINNPPCFKHSHPHAPSKKPVVHDTHDHKSYDKNTYRYNILHSNSQECFNICLRRLFKYIISDHLIYRDAMVFHHSPDFSTHKSIV